MARKKPSLISKPDPAGVGTPTVFDNEPPPGGYHFDPGMAGAGKTWGYRRVHVQATTPDGLIWRFTLHQALPDNIWQLVRAENVPVQISVSGVVAP